MFYGLDVHKEFIQVCALGAKGTKRREFRVAASAEAVERFARGLRSGDHVVLEATFHTWALHDILTRHVRHVVVANPLQVKAIAHASSYVKRAQERTGFCGDGRPLLGPRARHSNWPPYDSPGCAESANR